MAGSALITRNSAGYFADEWPEFVVEKLPLALSERFAFFEDLWLLALQVHVIAAAIALPGCLLLLSPTMLRHARVLHRYLGRVVGVVVLLALVPSGLVLALEAKGGAAVTAGFVVSALIVAVGMIAGIISARRRRFVDHRRAVLHVLAQLSVAVTSRAMLVALDALSVDEHLAYVASLWGPVLGSVVVVEVGEALTHVRMTNQKGKHHEAVVVARDPVPADGHRHLGHAA